MQPELQAAIVQDARDGRVLMLGWMNDEALRLTRESGEAWFWSRSRQELWHKGATSGNVFSVVEIRDDCDGDALVIRVDPAGPACHTGSTSCFAPALWRTVVERVRDRPSGSYVASLAEAGVQRAAQKVGEEGIEVALAAVADDGRLVAEAADLVFHLYVLLAVAGVDIAAVDDELARRAK
jgi:phosphoribosyl-ATP pyrophosphohydrolase/phosphoribosyl-AMP cyclohydrolase